MFLLIFFLIFEISAEPQIEHCLAAYKSNQATGDLMISDVSIKVDPYPVKLEKGGKIQLNGQFRLLRSMVSGYNIKLSFQAELSNGSVVPISCDLVSLNTILQKSMIFLNCLIFQFDGFSGCYFNVNGILFSLKESGKCDNFLPKDQKCNTPLTPGIYAKNGSPFEYQIQNGLTEFQPSMANITSLLVNLTLINNANNEILCLSTKLATTNLAFVNYAEINLILIILILSSVNGIQKFLKHV